MKKLLLLLFVSVAIVSCSDKKDDLKPETAIVGTWEGVSFVEKNYENSELTYTYTENYKDKNTKAPVVEFKADGSFTTINYDEETGAPEIEKGKYEVLDGNLILSFLNEREEWDTVFDMKIEGKEMTLHLKESETYQGVVYSWENTLIFKKK